MLNYSEHAEIMGMATKTGIIIKTGVVQAIKMEKGKTEIEMDIIHPIHNKVINN